MSRTIFATKLLPLHLRKITRRHTFLLSARPGNTMSTFGSWWDSGSRYTFRRIDLKTGKTIHVPVSTNPPQFGGTVEELTIPPGQGILTWNEGAKPAVVTLAINQPDLPLIFPDCAAALGLTDYPLLNDPLILADWMDDNGRGTDAQRLREFILGTQLA
jgi:hypothetical protein